jgi:hypothetical protein
MRIFVHVLAALALLLAGLLPVSQSAHAATAHTLLVIVGNATGMTDISLATLRRAFQNEPATTPSGKRLVPFNHVPGSAARTLFDRAVLGLEPDAVGRFWINRRIRDEGLPPHTVPSPELALRVVASLPGAITYVDSKTSTNGVRVLRVDGKLPNDPGYLLVGSKGGEGSSPSCCMSARLSMTFQVCTMRPASLNRCRSQNVVTTCLPVGGTPMTAVVCVALATQRPITQSSSATT